MQTLNNIKGAFSWPVKIINVKAMTQTFIRYGINRNDLKMGIRHGIESLGKLKLTRKPQHSIEFNDEGGNFRCFPSLEF
jgi:hypothetical protein